MYFYVRMSALYTYIYLSNSNITLLSLSLSIPVCIPHTVVWSAFLDVLSTLLCHWHRLRQPRPRLYAFSNDRRYYRPWLETIGYNTQPPRYIHFGHFSDLHVLFSFTS